MNLVSPHLPPVDHIPNSVILRTVGPWYQRIMLLYWNTEAIYPILSTHRFSPFHPLFGPPNNCLNASTHSELTPTQESPSHLSTSQIIRQYVLLFSQMLSLISSIPWLLVSPLQRK